MADQQGSFKINVGVVSTEAIARLKDLNAQMSRAQAPMREYQRQLKRYNDLTGRTAKQKEMDAALGRLKDRFKSLSGSIGAIARPLAAIFGLGSLAGIAAITRSFANWGNEIRNTASLLGITNDEASKLQQFGKLTGTDAAGDLQTYQDRQNQIKYGGDGKGQQANQLLQVDTKKTYEENLIHAVEYGNEMVRQGKWNQSAYREVMQSAGFDPKFAGQDPQRIRHQMNVAKENAKETARFAPDAQKLNDQILEATGRIDVLKTRFAAALSPVMGPMLKQFIDWTKNGPAMDAFFQKVTDGAKSIGDWIKTIDLKAINADLKFLGDHWKLILGTMVAIKAISFVGQLASLITDLTKALGLAGKVAEKMGLINGVKTAGEVGTVAEAGAGAALGAVALPAAGIAAAGAAAGYTGYKLYQTYQNHFTPAGVLRDRQKMMTDRIHQSSRYTTLERNQIERSGMEHLASLGYTKEQAAGVLAQSRQESGQNALAIGDHGHAVGMFQWQEPRQKLIEEHFHKKILSMNDNEQLDAFDWDLHHGEKKAGNALFNAKTLREATKAGLDAERPAEYIKNGENSAELKNRSEMANQIANVSGDINFHHTIDIKNNTAKTTITKNTTPLNPNTRDIKHRMSNT